MIITQIVIAGGKVIKDAELQGEIVHCYMCKHDYVHPADVFSGFGTCRDCFAEKWHSAMSNMDAMKEREAKA